MARSWWGWGNVEDAVTGAEADALVARAAASLPEHDLTDHAPPDPRDPPLAPPRVRPPASLERLCSADPVDRDLHGRLDHAPDLVARPRTGHDLVDLLGWCAGERIAVIPYGGGSWVVGGALARRGMVVETFETACTWTGGPRRTRRCGPPPTPRSGGPAGPGWSPAG